MVWSQSCHLNFKQIVEVLGMGQCLDSSIYQQSFFEWLGDRKNKFKWQCLVLQITPAAYIFTKTTHSP